MTNTAESAAVAFVLARAERIAYGPRCDPYAPLPDEGFCQYCQREDAAWRWVVPFLPPVVKP